MVFFESFSYLYLFFSPILFFLLLSGVDLFSLTNKFSYTQLIYFYIYTYFSLYLFRILFSLPPEKKNNFLSKGYFSRFFFSILLIFSSTYFYFYIFKLNKPFLIFFLSVFSFLLFLFLIYYIISPFRFAKIERSGNSVESSEIVIEKGDNFSGLKRLPDFKNKPVFSSIFLLLILNYFFIFATPLFLFLYFSGVLESLFPFILDSNFLYFSYALSLLYIYQIYIWVKER